MFKRPKDGFNRRTVSARIDEPVKQKLEMLGMNIPALIEELLNNVAEHEKCPCCGRIVKPVITGRNISPDLKKS